MGQGRNGGKGLRARYEECEESGGKKVIWELSSHGNQGGVCGWTSEAKQQNLCGGVAWQDPSLLQLAPLL